MKMQTKIYDVKEKSCDIQSIDPEFPIISNGYLAERMEIKILQQPKKRKRHFCAEGCLTYSKWKGPQNGKYTVSNNGVRREFN